MHEDAREGAHEDAHESAHRGDGRSKSAAKRDAHAVRDLGAELAALGESERRRVPLPDDVRAAIEELNRIRARGARKRQLGYLAKRLRQVDTAPIEAALDALRQEARAATLDHHRIVPIPLVEPGDTVWWHPDVVHAVGAEHAGDEYANVIYVGASPACAKNETYARRQAASFLEGRSPPDFAAEDHEVDFVGRATVEDLTALGRRQMGL